MPNIVLVIILIVALAVAVWFGMRYLLLKRSIRYANQELREIVGRLEDSRIVKLASPDNDLEAFLGTVNSSLLSIRQQAVLHAQHEAELRAQIEGISHDLRTPLTSIQGYLSLVDDEGLDDETRTSLATVGRKADSLQRLIAQFYELSCLRDDEFVLAVETVDIGRLLRESASGHYQLLCGRGLDVQLSVPQHPLWACANSDALERVFANLLNNAGKYAKTKLEVVAAEVAAAADVALNAAAMPRASATSRAPAARVDPDKAPSLGSAARTAAPQVLITFANDADQLDEDEVLQLLEPFYTADASRLGESTGLGLTISHHLVERMGGRLQVRCEVRNDIPWLVFELLFDGASCFDDVLDGGGSGI